jgi:hypothetical protein
METDNEHETQQANSRRADMKSSTGKRGLTVIVPVVATFMALASAAWACTLGVGPTDGFFPLVLSPPSAVIDADGAVSVDALAEFNRSPTFNGTTTVYQDPGLGTLGASFGDTLRVSGALPDQCGPGDPVVGTMTWVDNLGSAVASTSPLSSAVTATNPLTLQAASKSGGGYVPGVYEVCTFIPTDKLNRFIAYFTFV